MKLQGKIIIIDDNQSVLNSLKLFLKYKFSQVVTISNPNNILPELQKTSFDLVLLDMNFSAGINSGNEGLFWLNQIKQIYCDVPVVMITAYGYSELAVKAIKAGAFDFIEKPWSNQKLLATLKAAFELRKSEQKVKELEQQKEQIIKSSVKTTPLIYKSDEMQKIIALVDKVAQTNANVLILGENGTGKELIAQRIHKMSKRNDNVFMSVDMASLNENLFESELFGYKKGAFTDAKDDRVGKFEAAHGGSLFLDEIGNLSYFMQAKLLSALQNREISRLGATEKIKIDIRLISATNKNLEILVQENLFREDLLYRLNTVKIILPPLRDRKKDIIPLVNYYLKIFAERYNKPNLKVNNKAVDKILSYHWPGNIRELKHTIEKAVILCEQNVLTPLDFIFDKPTTTSQQFDKPLSLNEAEKIIIKNALTRNNWNISETAKELQVGRQTLYRKIEKYDI
ncbi:MAG: sigma-54 dependent transcriptional regulator [Bacteroidales bacterium]|nr:sigma-54 dependent transcriptional regulator [Bacteroidales bacterium]